MNLAIEIGSKSASSPGWRVIVDRAWRSQDMRCAFEAETSCAPLASDPAGRRAQLANGVADDYYRRFVLWAARRLGVEDEIPASIKGKIATTR